MHALRLLLILVYHWGVRGLHTSSSVHASVLTHIVVHCGVVITIITWVNQVVSNLTFIWWNDLLELEENFQGALLLGDACFVLHSWVEKTVFRQITDLIALRMLGWVNNQTLLVWIEIDLDGYLALEKAIVDKGAVHLLIAEALVDDADNHTTRLVNGATRILTRLSPCSTKHILLLILDFETPKMFTKAIAISCNNSASFIESEPLFAAFIHKLSAKQIRRLRTMRRKVATDIKILILLSRYVCYFGPFALLLLRHGFLRALITIL